MKTILTFSLLFLGIICFAQAPLSLQDAIEIGLKNNYQIQIAEKNIQIAKNNNNWGNTGRYPTVDVSVTNANSITNQDNPASFFTKLNSLSTGLTPALSANWVLYNGNRVKITKQQLEQLEIQGIANAQVTIENTIRAIILTYYQTLIQREQIGVLDEVLALTKSRIAEQKIRLEFGQAGKFDLIQTNDAYLSDTTNIVLQTNAYDNAMRNLNLVMGVDELNTIYTLTDQLIYDAPDYMIDDLKTALFSKNRNLQSLFVNRELANINTQLAQTTKRPIVSVGGNLAYTANLSNGSGTLSSGMSLEIDAVIAKTFNGGINLTASYNLYDGGRNQRSIENAQVQELITQMSIEDFKRSLSAQLEIALANYNNQKQLLQLTEARLNNAQENLDLAQQRLDGAKISSFDYRTIQLAFVNASQARLNAYYNLKVTETDIQQLIGGLVE